MGSKCLLAVVQRNIDVNNNLKDFAKYDGMIKVLCVILAVFLVGIVIGTCTSIIRHKKKTNYVATVGIATFVLVAVLSILSGLGNSVVILSINMGLSADSERRTLVVTFLLGLSIYIIGQKLVHGKMIKLTNRIVYEKRMEITRKLLESHYEDYEKIDNSVITATISNDTNTISGLINVVISGLTNFIVLICCLIYLGTINLTALLAITLIIFFVTTIYFFTGMYASKLGEQSRDLENVFFGFVEDMTVGMKELDLNQLRKDMFYKDMDQSCKQYNEKVNKSALAFANMHVIGELIFTFAMGFIVFLIPLLIKGLSQGDIISYVFVLLYITGPVHGILEMIPSIISIRISNRRIHDLLEKIQMSLAMQQRGKETKAEKIELSLKDVEYEYSKGHNFHIGPINFRFCTGEIVFITGGNGSGKSTLFKVLTGLYKPVNGRICVNGKEIENQDLRELYSAITSDYYLLKKMYGINYEEKKNEIASYLDKLDLDSKVSIENGAFSTINLSSGQRKRLALMVAYLEDRPFYIFDEWAAEQDPEFREFFYHVLLPELKHKGKCVIAITHDDRYFNTADKILKVDMGQKVENL